MWFVTNVDGCPGIDRYEPAAAHEQVCPRQPRGRLPVVVRARPYLPSIVASLTVTRCTMCGMTVSFRVPAFR